MLVVIDALHYNLHCMCAKLQKLTFTLVFLGEIYIDIELYECTSIQVGQITTGQYMFCRGQITRPTMVHAAIMPAYISVKCPWTWYSMGSHLLFIY